VERDRDFRGPLGIWHFPIINLILSIIRSRFGGSVGASRPLLSSPKGFENVEEIEVVEDEKGDIKRIIVHRRVVPIE